jgi:hypothetical protein
VGNFRVALPVTVPARHLVWDAPHEADLMFLWDRELVVSLHFVTTTVSLIDCGIDLI